MTIQVLEGDCRAMLATLPAESVQMVCTSPPYYGLRDYGTATWDDGDPACDHTERHARNDISPDELARRAAAYGTGTGSGSAVPRVQYRSICGKCGARRIDNQIGMEPSPDAYVAALVEVFRGVKRVLRNDGITFLNLGDSYNGAKAGNTNGGASSGLKRDGRPEKSRNQSTVAQARDMAGMVFRKELADGLAPKNLLGIPWRVAFALQADGWYLRSAITWVKPNPLPESVKDRPTSSYEMVFMLAKSATYFYDAEAISEQAINTTGRMRMTARRSIGAGRTPSGNEADPTKGIRPEKRNARNVWTIAEPKMRLRHDIPPEKRAYVVAEMARRGLV